MSGYPSSRSYQGDTPLYASSTPYPCSRRGSTTAHDPSYLETYAVRHDPRIGPPGSTDTSTAAQFGRRGSVPSQQGSMYNPRYGPELAGPSGNTLAASGTNTAHQASYHQFPPPSEYDIPSRDGVYSPGRRGSATVGGRRPSVYTANPFDVDVDGVTQTLAGASLGDPASHGYRAPSASSGTPGHLSHRRGSQTYPMSSPGYAQAPPYPVMTRPTFHVPSGPVPGMDPYAYMHPAASPYLGSRRPSATTHYPDHWSPHYKDHASRSGNSLSDAVTTAPKLPEGIKSDFDVGHGDFRIYKHGDWARVTCRDTNSKGELIFKHTEVSKDESEGVRTIHLAMYTHANIMKGDDCQALPGLDLEWSWLNFQDKSGVSLGKPDIEKEQTGSKK
ncbi:hypothetical protein IAU59_002504 [Kwoniella sp. CBS 9459]